MPHPSVELRLDKVALDTCTERCGGIRQPQRLPLGGGYRRFDGGRDRVVP